MAPILSKLKYGELEEVEVGGGGFDDEAEKAGDFEEDALFGGAFDADEVAFVAVKGAGADESHAAAVHRGGDFAGRHVVGLLNHAYGGDEAMHVGGADGHGLAVSSSFDVAVLERVGFLDYGVKLLAGGEYEQEVADKGDVLADAAP